MNSAKPYINSTRIYPPLKVTEEGYPVAIERLKSEQTLAVETELRQVKYSNNPIEQDHRNIRRIVKPMLGFKSFHSARRTLSGIEAMSMIGKGQVQGVERGDVRSQVEFVSQVFGLVASLDLDRVICLFFTSFCDRAVNKNAAYPVAIEALKVDKTLEETTKLRQSKYMNNVIEQDHRNIKRITKPMMEFGSFSSTRRTLSGIEAMSMIHKEQMQGTSRGDGVSQAKFIEELFGISA